jgi:hypothetical protein
MFIVIKCITPIQILHHEVNKHPILLYQTQFCERVSGVVKRSAFFKTKDVAELFKGLKSDLNSLVIKKKIFHHVLKSLELKQVQQNLTEVYVNITFKHANEYF